MTIPDLLPFYARTPVGLHPQSACCRSAGHATGKLPVGLQNAIHVTAQGREVLGINTLLRCHLATHEILVSTLP